MPLNFGGSTLFPQIGLLNEDGLLQERWGQEGSTVVTVVGNITTTNTIYTVTSGKKYYVKSITVSEAGAGGGNCHIRDGGAGGTSKLIYHETQAGNTTHMIFATPIVFSTDIHSTEGGNAVSDITFCGWEEDA